MLYVDFKLGNWYPKRGIYELPKAMYKLAQELGVNFIFDAAVTKINIENGIGTGVFIKDKFYAADNVVVNGDYYFAENFLLEEKWRSYSKKYWEKPRLLHPPCSTVLGLIRN